MSFALLPDGYKGWCAPAVFEAVRLIRSRRLEWFMTSCPPYSVHVIGLFVKLLTGARWVADFRDPWMTTGWKRMYPTSAASNRIEAWLERRVVERADLVVFNVDRLRNAYRQRYSHVPADKFVYIPNALPFAPASEPVQKFDRFTITYTGSLYVGRSPQPLFRALSQLIRAGLVARDALSVKLVGHCRHIDGAPTSEVIDRHGLSGVVEVHDQVPYADAVALVRRSHLALLLAPNLPYQIPAKVYDYLSAGTRILGIAEEGGTADILKETGAGVAFAEDDIDGIAAFITAELAGSQQPATPLSLTRFGVQYLTDELVVHMTRIDGRLAERYA
jgi:glycosyltransferase involved in cell wall biosynthesis